MNMMHGGCRCPHHWVAKIFRFLSGLAGLAFFVVVFRRAVLFGWSADVYFMSAIVLVIMAQATRMCRCCMGHGMGYMCKDCMPGKEEKMGHHEEMSM